MARRDVKPPDKPWACRNELLFFIVMASDREKAIDKAVEHLGYPPGKRYLAEGLDIRAATREDLDRYAPLAEAHRKSQPTVKAAKRKTVHERLFTE